MSFSVFDLIFLVLLVLYVYRQVHIGLLFSLSNLLGLIFSAIIGLLLYHEAASALTHYFSVSRGIANAVSFFIITSLVYPLTIALAEFLISYTKLHIPKNKILTLTAVIVASISYILLASFFVLLIIAFPTTPVVKNAIKNSSIGKTILHNGQSMELVIRQVFGEGIEDSMNFLTVKPTTNEIIHLSFQATTFEKDVVAEQEMFEQVNRQRQMQGFQKLTWNKYLGQAATEHALDMAKKSYFSHISLDSQTPLERLETKPINFTITGENLALAPDSQIAMQGLMKSKDHRLNLLSPKFTRIGIGVIDMGLYGKMFVQEFAD